MYKVFPLAVLAALALAPLAVTASAQTGTGCADHGVKPVQEPARMSPNSVPCGGGFTITLDGNSITSDSDVGCPDWTTTTVLYHVKDPSNVMPGFEPYKLSKVFEMKQDYECVACGYLWLLTCCEPDGAPYAIGNGYDDWGVRKCVEDQPVPGGQ